MYALLWRLKSLLVLIQVRVQGIPTFCCFQLENIHSLVVDHRRRYTAADFRRTKPSQNSRVKSGAPMACAGYRVDCTSKARFVMETYLCPLDSAPIAGQRSPLPRVRVLRRLLARLERHFEVSMK